MRLDFVFTVRGATTIPFDTIAAPAAAGVFETDGRAGGRARARPRARIREANKLFISKSSSVHVRE